MDITKAIELLTLQAQMNRMLSSQADRDALKLGIEALKRIKSNRKDWLAYVRLPGETK